MNVCHIIGNLTNDPEIRTVQTALGDQQVANFTVAVNRRHKDREYSDYFRVGVWGKSAENAAKYLSKGKKVAVTGVVTAQAYKAKDGTVRAQLEIQPVQMLEYLTPGGGRSDEPAAETGGGGFTQVEDDELPF